MNLQASALPSSRPYGGMNPPAASPAIGSVVLRHLRTPAEIESILHLRGEIDLSAHTADFLSLEKKETSWGSSARSNWPETS